MIKPAISNTLRKLRLLYILEYVRFTIKYFKTRKARSNFRKNNPGVKLPPDFLMYESFGLNYESYYVDGRETAIYILDIIKNHINPDNINILDWGCGPARVVRHLPELLPANCNVFGTDYNEASIKWCQKNLNSIVFKINHLPPH